MSKMQRIRPLIDELNRLTALYDMGTPEVTDKEWDDMYFELEDLEKRHNIVYPDSPTQSIHFNAVSALQKVEHNHPLLSLAKTKSIEDLEAFVGDKHYCVMAKMDGLTVSAKYLGGKLVSLETRGNGEIGEDIIHIAPAIRNLPMEIPYVDELVVDGEGIIDYNEFEKFKDNYANPRNLVSGSVRLLDAAAAAERGISFIAWKVYKGLSNIEWYSIKLDALDSIGFATVPRICDDTYDGTSHTNDLETLIEEVKIKSSVEGYPIDGCVIGIDNIKEAANMGETTAHHEKYQIAYKFYDEEYESTLRGIEWSMGRTGVLTPVAIFDDIDFGDSIVNRASLHNLSVMDDLYKGNWHTGLKISVYKANAIIPQISRVWFEESSCAQRVDCPICPICGKPTIVKQENNSKILYCDNPNCEGKFNKILEHFCSKKGLDIKGLSAKTIEKITDWGWVGNLVELYSLSNFRDEWIKKPGFGPASVDKILHAVDGSRNFPLDKFIAALGIKEIGTSAAKILAKRFGSWTEFRKAIADEDYSFTELEGFGDIMNDCLKSFDYTEADTLQCSYKRKEEEDIIEDEPKKTITESVMLNKKFCITGKLAHFKNRDEAIAFIEYCGGSVVGSVSAKVDYLVNNDIESTSSKNIKAKQLNIPIITEQQLLDLTNS